MAKSNIHWPAVLPPGLQSGREYRRESPNKRSKMTTGRQLQRRAKPGAPWYARVTWLMDNGEAQAFMAWARDILGDCNYWFNFPMKTPLGYNLHSVRIVNHYSGPSIAGPNLWSFSAEVEFDEGPLAPLGDGEFPGDLVYTELFDITMNRNWPKP